MPGTNIPGGVGLHSDGVCDDGGPGSANNGAENCAYGTDCADCGERDWTDQVLDQVLDLFRGLKVQDLVIDEMLYRDLRDRFVKGSTVTWWAFSSCTTSMELLETVGLEVVDYRDWGTWEYNERVLKNIRYGWPKLNQMHGTIASEKRHM